MTITNQSYNKLIEQKLRFLIFIDDDPTSNYIHELVLNNLKISNTHFFLSAKECLEFLSKQPENKNIEIHDIIFIDVNMPGIDGWQFIEIYQKRLRTNKNQQFFVMLSADLNHNDIEKSKEYKNVKDFLIKPLSEKIFTKFFQKHKLI